MPEDRFPYLFAFSSRQRHPLDVGRSVAFGGPPADVVLDDVPAGRLLFRLERDGGEWFLEPLLAGGAVTVDHAPVRQRLPLLHLALIQAGQHVFVFVERDDPRVSTTFAASRWLISQLRSSAPDLRQTLTFIDTTRRTAAELEPSHGPPEFPGAFDLPVGQVLIGRDAGRTDLCLPDVRVSRVHAWISRTGDVATIGDLKSANGTFVDGQRIREPMLVHEGSEIQIGPYNLVFTGTALCPLSHKREVQLAAQDLTCRVPDHAHRGRSKLILDGVSLVVRPRELVCVLGPSGCGKSTLLSALSARRPADEGSVLLNGEDLYAHFEALKQNLAVVPQQETLHDMLRLDAALRYTARLRLPSDTSATEIESCVSAMLEAVRLSEHRATRIRRLSGGQRKRAGWANEAICNPSLIFVDEVTSGLDELSDREMMELFRKMADDGKTVVLVTHRVGYVEQTCHLVAVLASGGVLAFVGPPAEALTYFGVSRLGEVYRCLQSRPAAEWKQQFRQSIQYRRYVEQRLPAQAAPKTLAPSRSRKSRSQEFRAAARQLPLLVRRYLAILLADKGMLAMMLGQSLLIALLLIWVFGDISRPDVEAEAKRVADIAAPGVAWSELLPESQAEFRQEASQAATAALTAKILFLLAISCLWFGCNNAAKEIVKERAIYRQERDVGLKVVSYYGSKLIVLGAASILQSTLLYAGVRLFTHLGGDGWSQYALLSLVSLTGVAIGLAISALADSEDVAVTMVPISLIPQIVLAGILAPLAGATRGLAQLVISAYWGYQGLVGTLKSPVQDRLRDAGNMDLGTEWDSARVGSVLVAHILVFAIVSLVTLRLRDNKENRR